MSESGPPLVPGDPEKPAMPAPQVPEAPPAPAAGYPQQPAYPQPPGYVPAPGYPQAQGYPQPPAYAPTSGYPQPAGYSAAPAGYGQPSPGYGQTPWGASQARQPDNLGSGKFRAQSVGEVVDAMFTVYRQRLLVILGASLVVQLPYQAVVYLLSQSIQPVTITSSSLQQGDTTAINNAYSTFGYVLVLLALSYLIVTPLLSAVMACIVGDQTLERTPSVRRAYAAAFRRFPQLVGMAALEMLILFAIGFVGSMVASIFILSAGIAGGVVAFGVVIVAVCIPYVRMILAPAVVILENTTGRVAISRSTALTKGATWRTLVAVGVAFVLTTVLTDAAVYGISALVQSDALEAAVRTVIQVFTAPLAPIVATLIYYDRRIRREAFDLEMLAAAL